MISEQNENCSESHQLEHNPNRLNRGAGRADRNVVAHVLRRNKTKAAKCAAKMAEERKDPEGLESMVAAEGVGLLRRRRGRHGEEYPEGWTCSCMALCNN